MSSSRAMGCVVLVLFVMALTACNRPAAQPSAALTLQRQGTEGRRISAAEAFTGQYARSSHAAWNVQARAAGPQCGVLLVHVDTVSDDSMIEGIHYGAGRFDAYPGGAQKLQHDSEFRGVAYTDAAGRVWTYDEVAPGDVRTMVPCQ